MYFLYVFFHSLVKRNERNEMKAVEFPGDFTKTAISEKDFPLPNLPDDHTVARTEHYERGDKSQVYRARFPYNERFRTSLFVHGRFVTGASQRFGKSSLTVPLKRLN